MKLHLACGTNILPGWTNVDLEPQAASVIRADLTRPLPFADGSVDVIYSEHFIEHIPKQAAYAFVGQCFQKLKPGGRIRVSTPNLARLTRQYEYGKTDSWRNILWAPETRADMVNEGTTFWGHKYLYDWPEIEKMFRKMGFVDISRQKWGNSSAEALNRLESRPDNGEIILEACKPLQRAAKPPVVSVVIGSYNHEAYVGATLDSVLNQTFQDFEILVTDDGSSDRTADVVASYTDPRIKLKRFEKNKGACWATNDGIRRSQGKYIAILNSDDEFMPHKLQKQVEFLDAHPEIGAVFAFPEMINEKGERLPDAEQATRAGLFIQGNRNQAEWLLRLFQSNCLCHPSVLIRRACYDKVGLYSPNLRSLPDYEMWIRLLQVTNIHVMQEKLIRMRVFSGEINESGNRPDQVRRMHWEFSQVLRRFMSTPDYLWTPIIKSQIDLSRFAQVVSFKRELEFAALCLRVQSLAHVMAAMQVLGSVSDESDETAIPVYQIYNDLATHLDYALSGHKQLLSVFAESK